MPKVLIIEGDPADFVSNPHKRIEHIVWCPGCKSNHSFDLRWSYNNNPESPTFNPSLLVSKDDPNLRCHSFVRDGKWQFLNDCHHNLAGKTVDMEDVDY